MRNFVISSLVFFAVMASSSLAEKAPAIMGGVNAFPGEFPFLVSMQWTFAETSAHFCGGSIISPIWILTAAHCMTEAPSTGVIEVLAGRHNLAVTSETGQARHSISETIIHPGWPLFARNHPNDIALVRLWIPLTFSDRIRAIQLPISLPNGVVTFAGWGNVGTAANILQRVNIFVAYIGDCRNFIIDTNTEGTINDDTNICTAPFNGVISLCNGDFGGPLIHNDRLGGVASWGTPCGSIGPPAIFTDVLAFNQWIFEFTGLLP